MGTYVRVSPSYIAAMLAAVCLLSVCLAAALAQVPTTCPGPQIFTSNFARFDRERQYMVRGLLAYDGNGQRIREIEEEDFDGNRVRLDRLKLFKENKEYRLDLKTGKCNVTEPHHFHPYGVPDNSTFLFESKMGNDTFFVDVSEPSCFPVHHTWIGMDRETKKQYIESTDFFDGREGVANDIIFDVPLACKFPGK